MRVVTLSVVVVIKKRTFYKIANRRCQNQIIFTDFILNGEKKQ